MAFYSYSVKETLRSFFGESIIDSMRKPHDTWFTLEDEKNLIPLLWQYADEQAVDLCLEDRYLLDTIIEDDYIAYIIQKNKDQYAYLMFMVTEDNPLFCLDTEYAKTIIKQWESNGYRTFILRECIGFNGFPATNQFSLCTHLSPGLGAELYELGKIHGSDALIVLTHSCWSHYARKLVWLSKTQNKKEYECLFENDVKITKEQDRTEKLLSSGIDAVMRHLDGAPLVIAYRIAENSNAFRRVLISGSREIDLSISRRNLIATFTYKKGKSEQIIDRRDSADTGLLAQIPKLRTVKALDVIKIHGYAIQAQYEGNIVRKYYLANFTEREIPSTVLVDGFEFSESVLNTVTIDADGAAVFSNGYVIPRHILYYHSYRQAEIEKTDVDLCSYSGVIVHSWYRLPLLEIKSMFSARQYWGTEEECFGPAMPWVDKYGNRTSEISLYRIGERDSRTGASEVLVEPTGKHGYLLEDGSWLAPPIYDSADDYEPEGYAKAVRIIEGIEKTVFLSERGEEILLPQNTDIRHFTNGRSAFNVEEWNGEYVDRGYYWDYDYVKPGKWGFIDLKGNIVIEPKYVFAIGFYNGGGEHSIVARFVDGKLSWGVIDLDGNEVIPCQYPELYSRWGEAVAFRLEEDGLYGLMDFDGHIIIDPMFGYIEAYDPKHRMITAGEDGDNLGVFSLDKKRMITPATFDCVDYDEHIITCEMQSTYEEKYYDYDGNELSFPEYDSIYEADDQIHVRVNGKVGIINLDGKELIPPVLDSGLERDIELYKKGFVISNEGKKQYGISRVTGECIVPNNYSSIDPCTDFIIGRHLNDANWCIRDTLFLWDGKKLLEGPYRRIKIDERTQEMTVETPLGKEFCTIEHS